MMVGVSSRTRSKNVPSYGSLSLSRSSKRIKKEEDDMSFAASGSKKRKGKNEPFVLPSDAKVIFIDDDVKEEEESEENGGFVDEKPTVIHLDESGESDEEDSDCDDSEENESSDEDFSVNEVSEVSESDEDGSSSSCSAYVNEIKRDSSRKYLEVVGEMVRKVMDDENSEISEKKKISKRKKIKSSDGEESEISKKKKIKSSDGEENEIPKKKKILSSDGEESEISKKKKIKGSDGEENEIPKKKKILSSDDKSEDEDDGSVATTTTRVLEKKVDFDPTEGCCSFSKLNVASERKKEKNVSDVNVFKSKGKGRVKHNESLDLDPNEGKEQNVRGVGDGEASVTKIETEEKVIKKKGSDDKDKASIQNDKKKETVAANKGRDDKGKASIQSDKKKETVAANKGLNQRRKSTLFMRKELRLFELLAEFYWGNKDNTVKNDSTPFEVKNDDVNRPETRPPSASVETRPLIWSLKKKEVVQKSKEEEEVAKLWDEMERSLREIEAESMIGKYETTHENLGNPSTRCEHDLRLDEEIGVYCRLCRWVETEIRYVSEQVVDKFPNEGSRKRVAFDNVNVSHFDGSQFKLSDNYSDQSNFSFHDQGTVWELIPDVKKTLYPHQQEGFEFIWKNLAGSIELHKLKNADPQREGGCIMSHAPGTGKTRLTIVFLATYLRVFPKCLPVIVAPASLLLTWEEEFKKWDIGFPFHNLSNLELSGKEHVDALNLVSRSNSGDTTRMAKLISWNKERSILGISYSLYEKLAGGGGSHDEKNKKQEIMGNVLREKPGLLVLDEGHTPRNKKSGIWKELSKSHTKKRIILSGTPFQNNFLELYNTLSLVKPSFPSTLPDELKKFCQKPEQKKATKEWSWKPDSGSDDKIKQLKLHMDPLVHVHKGAILEKKLPGIRNRVLRLKADSLQKQTIESIQSSQGTFTFEHKLTMASIHPSLFLECELLEKEESVLDKVLLEKVRLDSYIGVKTKFLVEFVRLCDAANEKVLVFSQFIKPLRLIIEQLSLACNWTEGKEMLFLDGEVDLKGKQSLIHNFNGANCQAKILLASVKANSEGISLVGASRVVLLDVVWNPSVKRQAISRAYRIGQKRVVYTYHLLIDGTTECVKHCKQAEKDRLSELVFQAKNNGNDELEKSGVKFEDSILEKMIQHKELKDMFVE
ncbi:SNF2 domain-containing protein CLASSY 3-like [Vicia villosa]|uniref:SNF2 domain-containing protein CLASSY 3-like n=1 Tax=Vicia villosa TaxID=3911 RepID=UPI00273C34DB|nr:SNF2 domain-containing protein CLASSY 3-like [Vicia villosa]